MGESSHPTLVELRRLGLLLKQDKHLPSVVGIVTGESLRTSWWSHPQAQEIFDLLAAFSQRSDILETKLLGGKVTFVFKTLWPAWLGVATAGEPWQSARLSVASRRLLAEVNRTGNVEATGSSVKELERRLSVRTEQRHAESGKHVLVLESWQSWAERHRVQPLPLEESKAALERAALALGAPLRALPWHSARASRSARRG